MGVDSDEVGTRKDKNKRANFTVEGSMSDQAPDNVLSQDSSSEMDNNISSEVASVPGDSSEEIERGSRTGTGDKSGRGAPVDADDTGTSVRTRVDLVGDAEEESPEEVCLS